MLSAADGTAPWAQPLTTNPAAPARFIPWKSGERPVTLPVVISR
jgi:hypothetical protein